jgi:hypothetical protein
VAQLKVRRGSVKVRRDSDKVRRGSVKVRRGSVKVRRGSAKVRRGSEKVRRGSVGSASACCKAGPSSILGSAPHGGSSLAERRSAMRIQEDRPRRMVKDE